MLHALKLYSQQLVESIATHLGIRQREVFSLRHTGGEMTQSYKDLDYKKVTNAVLITEIDDRGEEKPIAVAYVKDNHDVVLVYLSQLGEVE